MLEKFDLIKHHRKRGELIGHLVLLAFGIILARLWYLQVHKGELLYRFSLKNRLRQEPLVAPRGMIFDRNNRLIVSNVPEYDVMITPQFLKEKERTIKLLGEILSLSPVEIKDTLKKNAHLASYRPILVKKNISRKELSMIETENLDLPGVSVDTFIGRVYQDQGVSAHLLGYISEISQKQLDKVNRLHSEKKYKLGDYVGQLGIEEKFDYTLKGQDGHEFMEVDARGRKRRHINTDNFFKGIKNLSPIPGKHLRLTIDSELQKAAHKALGEKDGSVVMTDVHTGEILVMVSTPGFNPTNFGRGLGAEYWAKVVGDPSKPLINRSIQEHYAPGSVFKAFSAITALEEKIIDKNTEVVCKGIFKLGRRKIHCWLQWGHGKMTLREAIRQSCNVYFYKMATKMDIDILAKYARLFGLGQLTKVALPREVKGLIPTRDWKKKKLGTDWALGETLSCVIGQSYVLVTPLQLAMAYAAIANGGTLYRPQVVAEIFSPSGLEKRFKSDKVRQIPVKEKTLKMVREGLFQVANHPKGTAYYRRGQGILMAGKTGTSQVVSMSSELLFKKCDKKEYKFRNHGIFVAYAPSHKPKVAISVVAEHQCSGSKGAAPIARDVLMAYMNKYWPLLEKQNRRIEAVLQRRYSAVKGENIEGD